MAIRSAPLSKPASAGADDGYANTGAAFIRCVEALSGISAAQSMMARPSSAYRMTLTGGGRRRRQQPICRCSYRLSHYGQIHSSNRRHQHTQRVASYLIISISWCRARFRGDDFIKATAVFIVASSRNAAYLTPNEAEIGKIGNESRFRTDYRSRCHRAIKYGREMQVFFAWHCRRESIDDVRRWQSLLRARHASRQCADIDSQASSRPWGICSPLLRGDVSAVVGGLRSRAACQDHRSFRSAPPP